MPAGTARPDRELSRHASQPVLLVLLGIWILMGVIGLPIKGLFLLFVIALVAFGFTLAGDARRCGILRR